MIQLATMDDVPFTKNNVELGFNLSKTFENHLKHLITQFSTGNSVNNHESTDNGGAARPHTHFRLCKNEEFCCDLA
jgi:hypothetical protein